MTDKIACILCEVEIDGSSVARAWIRGFAFATLVRNAGAETIVFRQCLCLKHCDRLKHHLAWVRRNAGKPTPWPEPEPRS